MADDIAAAAESCVVRAFDEVNATRDEPTVISTDPATELLGPAAPLDSVTFAFLIVTIEQFSLDDYDRDIVLFDEEAMGWDYEALDNPFYTVGSLTTYVAEKMAAA